MNLPGLVAAYFAALRRRFWLLAIVRGIAVVALAALLLSLGLSWRLAAAAPSPRLLLGFRAILGGTVVAAALVAIWLPLRRCRLVVVIDDVERRWPAFDSRLRTLATLLPLGAGSPLVPLLAEETLALAPAHPVRHFVPHRMLAGFGIAGLVSVALLAGLLMRPQGRIAYWAQALWRLQQPFFIEVRGDRVTVARGRALNVMIRSNGFSPPDAELWVKPAGVAEWRRTPLQPDGERVFRGSIKALAGGAEYFASAEGIRSPVARVRVIELPLVTSLEMVPAGGSIRVVIETDRPMIGGELAGPRGGTRVLHETQGNRTESEIAGNDVGRYYVGVRHEGELVPVSDDFDVMRYEQFQPKPGNAVPPPVNEDGRERVPRSYEDAVRRYYQLIGK
ncbi:MAG: hypothetical protein ABI759_25920 [Candidatus Solibacter sp.]